MGAFNSKRLAPAARTMNEWKSEPSATTNKHGALAFKMSTKMDLYTRVASCLIGQDKFYVTGAQANRELAQILKAAIADDPQFVLDLATFARNKLNLRSVPLALLAEVANQAPGQVKGSRKYVGKVVRRADEILEIIAYQLERNKLEGGRKKQKLPNMLQKGLASVFSKFDEYQFQKYSKQSQEVTFKDAMFIIHPKAKNEKQLDVYKRIITDDLAVAGTWENITTVEGSNKDSWEKAIPAMGYMALMRNLKNFIEKGVDRANMDLVYGKLRDKELVHKSKQFPYRYWTAWNMMRKMEGLEAGKAAKALEDAMEISTDNVPKIKGKTLVIVDVSGSMRGNKLSKNSEVTCANVSTLFGAIAHKVCEDATVMVFADAFAVVNVDSRGSILHNMQAISSYSVGGSTYAARPIMYMTQQKEKFDRMILFSDQQCYGYRSGYDVFQGRASEQDIAPAFLDYRQYVNPQCRMYTIDLAGYGEAKFPENAKGVFMLAGWSDSIFSFMNAIETDEAEVVKMISEFGQSFS